LLSLELVSHFHPLRAAHPVVFDAR